MERLEEMLAGLGALIRERECELQERIELLEKKVDELQEQLSALQGTGVQIQVPQIYDNGKQESDVAHTVGEEAPEIEIEFEFEGGESDDDDWADEYEEGDVVEDGADIEEIAGDAIGEVSEDVAAGVAEDEDDTLGKDQVEQVGEIEEFVEVNDQEYFMEEDTTETVGNIIVNEQQEERILVVDKARPEWYDWEVDIPGAYIDDIWEGIGLNDRMLFLRELFGGDEDGFREAVERLNGMERLVQATEYIRERYPQWNEESDEVYRFYMTVRRRFNKQKQEG